MGGGAQVYMQVQECVQEHTDNLCVEAKGHLGCHSSCTVHLVSIRALRLTDQARLAGQCVQAFTCNPDRVLRFARSSCLCKHRQPCEHSTCQFRDSRSLEAMSTTHKTSASRPGFSPGRKSKERAPTSLPFRSNSDSSSFSAHPADDREEDYSEQEQQPPFPPLSSMASSLLAVASGQGCWLLLLISVSFTFQ